MDSKTGKLRTLTEPSVKRWMEECIQYFECQLSGIFRTDGGETLGEWLKHLRTAQCLPLDDSLGWMIPGEQSVVVVPKGEEGAEIIIERIQ